jgi:nitrogen fixation protein
MSIDEALLFVSGDDGAVVIFDVRDKEVRVAKRDRELLPFAEEILVTKTDLEEQVAIRNDLKQKVDELTLQNEYQLRLKEMNHQEKLKELTEKFTIEVDCEKARYGLTRSLPQTKNVTICAGTTCCSRRRTIWRSSLKRRSEPSKTAIAAHLPI